MVSKKTKIIYANKFYPKRMNLKQKIKILEELEAKNFDYQKIPEYIAYSNIPGLLKPVLTAVVKHMVVLDTQISAAYDLADEDEWENHISQAYSTPQSLNEDKIEIMGKIKLLTDNFSRLCKILDSPDMKSEDILEIVEEIFKNKTKNIQFILFRIAKSRPKHVFGYLMAKLRKYPLVYAPFFCSLLVRLRLEDTDFKLRCAKIYFKHIESLGNEKTMVNGLLVQFMLYILCFNKNYINELPGINEFLKKTVFEAELYMTMNRDILDMFCQIFGYEIKCFESVDFECIHYFPFDAPICSKIYDIIKDDFVVFS